MARILRGAPAWPRPVMARGGRLPPGRGRPPRFLSTRHRRAIGLSEAHLQAARKDCRPALGSEALGGVRQTPLFHRASRGLRAHRATFRVLAEGDPKVDAALAFRGGVLAAAEVADAVPATALTPEEPSRAKARRSPDCPESSGGYEHGGARIVAAPG